MRLKHKVAIITGAANGLGLEAAITFVREGAKVALTDYDTTGAQRAKELKEQGADVEFFQVDVANRESVD
ncbi:SDR family NAD(P)-dependent oxidoreductase, partial [Bacillus sp. JJ1533]|uniref:SDR family NAD(P)-dependent oxidoreductase n=1 Tax=Bacillus sp. JJ1533 TaxID=3122959 RepID=UPI002FFE746E